MTIYGYIRVSRDDQNTGRQEDALRSVADSVVIERASAAKQRPAFDLLLKKLGKGDVLAVQSLDRAFRSTQEALFCADELKKRGADFRILNLGIDTSTDTGRLFLTFVAALAEFERSQLITRTKQGLEAAKARGVTLGRPQALSPDQIHHAIVQINHHGKSVSEMADLLNVSRSTLHRALKREEDIRALPHPVRKLAIDISTWAIMKDLDLSDAAHKLRKALQDIPRMQNTDKDTFTAALEVARKMEHEAKQSDEGN